MPTNGAEVLTSTVGMKDEAKGRMVQKARVKYRKLSILFCVFGFFFGKCNIR